MNGKRRLIGSYNHGSMANAMPMALGAQAAFPGRQVVSLSGDGGFTMLMGDLISLVQLRLPVKVIVYNNGSLAFVAMEMKAARLSRHRHQLGESRLRRDGERDGAARNRVEDSAEVEPALRRAFAHNGPVLFDARTAKQELAMPPKIALEQAKGFSLFLLKAIMNGRGDEILELVQTNLRR